MTKTNQDNENGRRERLFDLVRNMPSRLREMMYDHYHIGDENPLHKYTDAEIEQMIPIAERDSRRMIRHDIGLCLRYLHDLVEVYEFLDKFRELKDERQGNKMTNQNYEEGREGENAGSRRNYVEGGLKERIDEVLSTLTDREREVIKLRYGLGNGDIYTLEEVGKIFQVTRERVRQIEAKAIRKLQHPVRARKLEGFLDSSQQILENLRRQE